MTGLIFVQDAQGTPLMPMASAHARVLLGNKKARWLPHHAFMIVQLSRVIEQPVLRPVIVGVTVNRNSVECFLVAEGVRNSLPLAHIIIDSQRRAASRSFKPKQMPLSNNHIFQRQFRYKPVITTTRIVSQDRQPQGLERTVRALRRLLPISHVILLPSRTNTETEKDDDRYKAKLLAFENTFAGFDQDGVNVFLSLDHVSGTREIQTPLIEKLLAFHKSPQLYASTFVAVSCPETQKRLPSISALGKLCVYDQARYVNRGIVVDEIDERLTVQIPTLTSLGLISWTACAVQRTAVRHILERADILFLPIH